MVTISLVSHGHADMIVSLTKSLLKIKEIEKIIVTLNIPEAINLPRSNKIKLINNKKSWHINLSGLVVSPLGLEPRTIPLKGECSTN